VVFGARRERLAPLVLSERERERFHLQIILNQIIEIEIIKHSLSENVILDQRFENEREREGKNENANHQEIDKIITTLEYGEMAKMALRGTRRVSKQQQGTGIIEELGRVHGALFPPLDSLGRHQIIYEM